MRYRCFFAGIFLCLSCTARSSTQPQFETTTGQAQAPVATRESNPNPINRPKLRLPDDVAPKAMALALALDPAAASFRGTIHTEIELTRPRRDIWLHAQGLTIERALVRQGNESFAAATTVRDDYLGVLLPSERSGMLELTISYTGLIDDKHSQGIYRVAEPDGNFYVYTIFEPTDARRGFPCFDEPSFKIPWRLTIDTPPGSGAYANTSQQSAQVLTNGWTRRTFAQSAPLPSYLVAFMVGPFDVVESGHVGQYKRPLRFIVPPGHREELTYAQSVTAGVVEQLESFFGLAYPFEKLDVAVVPRDIGTMEHPGLVAMGQPLTLIKPNETNFHRQRLYTNVLAHELGHYWFGDLVTMRWWDETWLNEGTTMWVDRVVTAAYKPTWNMDEAIWLDASRAMRVDALANARPMRQPIVRHEDIASTFDGASTYFKGTAIMSMFDHWLSPAIFRSALRKYLEKHAWRTTVTEDLVAALNEHAGQAAGDALLTFIDQVGLPQLTFSLHCANANQPTTQVRLQQQRYQPLGQSYERNVVWKVPVCLRWAGDKGEKQRCYFVDQAQATIDLATTHCPKWWIPNANGAGYYHAKLDDATRQMLARARKHLNAAERYRYLHDLNLALDAGDVGLDEVLQVSQAWQHDERPAVTFQVFAAFGQIDERWLDERELQKMRKIVGRLARPLVRRHGWEAKPNESPQSFEMRHLGLWWLLGFARDERAIQRAQAKVGKWLAGGDPPPEEMRHLLVSTAAAHGDAKLFDHMVAKAHGAQRSDKSVLYAGLGNFTQPELLDRALNLLLDESVDVRESSEVLYAALDSAKNSERAFAFVVEHLHALVRRFDAVYAANLFTAVGRFCDEEHRQRAQAVFAEQAAHVPGATLLWQRALARVDTCLAKKARLLPQVQAFLAKHGE